jgi:hypothetical protein
MATPRSRPSAPDGPPLLALLRDTLIYSGCELLRLENTHPGSFRLSFEDGLLRRSGIAGLLFRLKPFGIGGDRVVTTVRLPDSLESGPTLRDPFGLFANVLLGVDAARGLFVAFDPARHFPEDESLRVSISVRAIRAVQEHGWHSWTREGWERRNGDFAETLIGFRRENLLTYLEFERIAVGLDTGHRGLLADAFLDVVRKRSRRA